MQECNYLYALAFTVGGDSGIALVSARNDTDAMQILRNSGKYNGVPLSYIITKIMNIGLTTTIRTELLFESYVNAMGAFDALIRAVKLLKGDKGDKGDPGDVMGAQSDWNEEDRLKLSYILNKPDIPTKLTDLEDDKEHRLVTDVNIASWTNKQEPIPDINDIRAGASEGYEANIRQYDSVNPNGMGYIALDKDRALEEQVLYENTIYEIRYDYDLNTGTVTIPSGCTLNFVGGSVSNGTLALDGTLLEGDVKAYCSLSGTMRNRTLYSSWNNDVHLAASNAMALSKNLCIDKGVTLNAPLSLFGLREVEIRGTITNSETNYIEIGYSSSTTLPVKVDIWNASYIKMTGGKEMIVTIRHCENLVLEADSTVSSKGSIAYCTFHLGWIKNFSIIGKNNGWINENTFIKGRFITTFTIQGATYVHNHNVFYNPTFEGNLTISLDKCSYNVFRDCRMEGSPTMVFGSTATNNRFYRSWLDTPASLWRMFYGAKSKNNNGVYFDDSTVIKHFTIDRNTYTNGRDLAKVSLCDDNLSVRHEVSGVYATLKVTPKSNFGVIMNSDNSTISRMRVYLFDQNGDNITDTVTTYINGITSFTKETGTTYTYYQLARDDNYAYLEVRVDSINQLLLTTYGVDSNENPVKQIGYVNVSFYPSSVRKVFNYVDIRVVFPANARDNAGVNLILPFASPNNISDSNPTIKSTISGTAVPYSLLDGEECLNTTSGILYRRTGDTISAITKNGFNGSYESIAGAPDFSAVPKCVVCSDLEEYYAIEEKDPLTFYVIPPAS